MQRPVIFKFPQTGKEKPGKNRVLALSTRKNKELEDAFTMLKLRKTPGPDNITNEMLLLATSLERSLHDPYTQERQGQAAG